MAAGIAFSPSDLDMVARVMAAESRDGSPREQAAIASVMRNRVLSGGFGGNNIMSVLTARTKNGGFQFTPLGIKKGEPNSPYDVDPNDPVYQSARTIAQEVFSGRTKDPTSGAVNYFAPKTQKALNQPDPDFSVGRKGLPIGQHSFYGPAPQPKDPYAVDNPDAFMNEHINQGAKAATPSSPTQNDPYAVADPDSFMEQHISGQAAANPTQVASAAGTVDPNASAVANPRTRQAFGEMAKQPDMVERMFPIRDITDISGDPTSKTPGGMARRYGYYAATDPLGTGIKTAAGLGALVTAPAWAPAMAAPMLSAGSAVLSSPWAKLGVIEEIANNFRGVKGLYDLTRGAFSPQ